MITEEYLKDNFLTAYFVDNERKNIEIQTTTEDKKSVFTTIIPFKEENPQYQALNKFMTLDQLHESTHEKNKTQHQLYKEQAMKFVKESGLVLDKDIHKLDTKFYPAVIKSLLRDVDNVDHNFALKLALFEEKSIIESDDIEGKKKLRQAKNKIDTIITALNIIKGK